MKWLLFSILLINGVLYSHSFEEAEPVECPIGNECEKIEDASKIPNSRAVCMEEVCECNDDTWKIFEHDNGTLECYPVLGAGCNRDGECEIENSVCVDQECKCDDQNSYIAIKEDTKCGLKANEENAYACEDTAQCKHIDTDIVCDIKAGETEGTCKCTEPGEILSCNACVKEANEGNNYECENIAQCKHIDDDIECDIEDGEAVGTCKCTIQGEVIIGNECVVAKLELAESKLCETHIDCVAIVDDSSGSGNTAICAGSEAGKECRCIDDAWLIFTDGADVEVLKCYPGIDAVCPEKNYACNDAITDAYCNTTTDTCQCSEDFVSTSNYAECLPSNVYLAESGDITCEDDVDCEDIRDPSGEQPTASAKCNKNKELCSCVGKNWTIFTDGDIYACYRGLGALCEEISLESPDCVAVENAECKEESPEEPATCKCLETFIESSNKCLERASSDNGYKCEDKIQCDHMNNIDSTVECNLVYGKCVCTEDGFVVRPVDNNDNSACIPVIGSSCVSNQDCTVAEEYSECKVCDDYTLCKCIDGYKPAGGNINCVEEGDLTS